MLRAVADPQATRLHLPASLRSAAQRGGPLQRQDIHHAVRAPQRRRILFVVDTSGSVGLAGQTEVALIAFRGPGAELLLGWTAQHEEAEAAIRGAVTGGRTPLAHALQLAAQVLSSRAEVVLFTDGRANVPLSPGSDAWADALAAARALQCRQVTVVDTETGHVRLGRAGQLAQMLSAQLLQLPN